MSTEPYPLKVIEELHGCRRAGNVHASEPVEHRAPLLCYAAEVQRGGNQRLPVCLATLQVLKRLSVHGNGVCCLLRRE